MKKFAKFFVFICAVLCVCSFGVSPKHIASAEVENQIVNFSTFSNDVASIIDDYAKFTNRTAGSAGEKTASEYIKNYLDTKTVLKPLNNAYIENGVQKFKFESKFSGLFESSQNIVYSLKSTKQTDKKVVIGCHYDSVAFDLDLNSDNFGDIIDSQSINGSAGNVASLLVLAKYLPSHNFDFNIEFVFFGAGESDNAGSNYYTTGISDEEKNNIICMINVNQVAFGQHLYFYMNEIETKSSNYVEGVALKQRLDVQQINISHLNKILLNENDVLGLGYSHVALDSDHVNFMKEGIQTINLFSGDYTDGIVIGRQEMAGKDLLTYTANDNISYILENFENYSIERNLFNVYRTISTVLTDSEFVKVFENSQGETNWFYAIFTNENLVFYLTIVAFIIFVIVAMYIYYKLSIKAYHANVEVEFLSSVMKISEHIDKDGNNEEVAKVVTKVVANDIKKDKVIKVKSTKKDKNNK